MKLHRWQICCAVVIVGFSCLLSAQQGASAQTASVVPQLVNYSGKALDSAGKPVAGIAGATFAIYAEQSGGAPLWMETQNIQADAKGNYSVQLGATSADGLPLELFASGQARWLGVRVNGSEEQSRVLLLSVPYALKAADAQTLGGLPASAFLLAGAANAAAAQSNVAVASPSSLPPPSSSDVTTSGGTVNKVPLFTTATNVQSSIVTQTGSGTTAKIGINTATPATSLDVNGAATVRGNLSLPATGAASTTAGKNSQPLSFTASSYNSSAGAAVNQNFRWQAEPTGNDTASTGGTLNLLYSVGANAPAETGLKVGKNGQISFAAGQTFPIATGGVTNTMLENSSVTVTPGTALTGGGKIALGGAATLNVDTTKVPLLAAANVFPSNQTFAGGLTASTTGYIPIIEEAPESGNGAALEMETTGSGGMFWQILNTGAGASQGANKLNFRNDSAGIDAMTIAANGNVGIGTTIPGANLDMAQGLTINGLGGTLFSTQYDGVNAFAMNAEPSTSGGTLYGSGWTLYDYAYGKWVAGISQVDGAVGINQGSPSYALDVLAENGGTYAAFFGGNIDVDGTVSTASASLQIDDPVDPANKYLYHSSVESPDMMNIYNGNVTTDSDGNATVQMPDWFEALNRDFRYQLTVIGQPSQAYVSQELASGAFSIKTDKPNVKVSWQVTGIRQDAWANAHRMAVEVQKSAAERGNYLHPELFGASQDKKIPVRQPRKMTGMMKPQTMKTPAHFSQTKQAQIVKR